MKQWFSRVGKWFYQMFLEPIDHTGAYVQGLLHRRLKLRDICVRPYDSADFESCMKLYQKNAPGRFPSCVESQYAKFLNEDCHNILVIENSGRVVATCCIFASSRDIFHFGYGLVEPSCHDMGIGTLMFFLRVAHLPRPEKHALIQISAVQASMPFYEKLGFVRAPEGWKDAQEKEHPVGVLWVDSAFITASRLAIARLGISLPVLPSLYFDPNPEVLLAWNEDGTARFEPVDKAAR